MKFRRPSTLVYSTDLGRTCPDCRKPVAECRCRAAGAAPRGDGVVRVARETKGRKGAGVPVITGLPLGETELSAMATTLKKRCGSGGTVKDGKIEIQGDHRDKIKADLEKRGYSVKLAGG